MVSEDLQGIAGLVIAGGKSTRMGGCDKAMIDLNGKPMIAWVMARFRPQVDSLILNTNSNDKTLAALGCPIVADAIAGHAGPLAGLHAGLRAANRPLLACVPCDAPLLPLDLVSRLREAMTENQDIAVARTASGLQPTFLLCRSNCSESIARFLARGGRAFQDWLAEQCCVEVEFSDDAAFSNVNTPEDRDRIQILLEP